MNFEAIIREIVSAQTIKGVLRYSDKLVGFTTGQNWLIFLVEKFPNDQFKVYKFRTKAEIMKMYYKDEEKYNLLLNITSDYAERYFASEMKSWGTYKLSLHKAMYNLTLRNIFVSEERMLDKNKLGKLLVFEWKLGLGYFEQNFGQLDETADIEGIVKEKYNNWTIFFDATLKKPIEELKKILDTSEGLLQQKNLGKLCYGDVVVTGAAGKVLADYDETRDVIRISFNELRKGKTTDHINSMIHELGHRNYDKNFDANIRKEVYLMYYQKMNDTPNIPRDTIAKEKKTQNTYKVVDKEYARNMYYVIELLHSEEPKAVPGKRYRVEQKYFDIGFEIDPSLQKPERKAFFPNTYAMKNVNEFYAVLFAHWVLNRAEEPAKSWMNSIH